MMNEGISQYYITQPPTITDIQLSANPISTGGTLTITMSITQSPRYLYPETYYPGEMYAGEVTE